MNAIWRMVSVAVLTLLLLIPLGMVESLVRERQGSMVRAQDQISAGWGPAQVVGGPVLVVPTRLTQNDPSGLRQVARFRWGEQDLEVNSAPFAGGQFAALVADLRSQPTSESILFDLTLTLAGSSALKFLPLARETRVDVSAPWADPGFVGAYLPHQRKIEDSGFDAHWQVLALNRQFGQVLIDAGEAGKALSAAAFGVELVVPANVYQRSERAAKYGILFVAVTFLGFFVFETVAAVRLHPIQYLFVGLALCSFYLVLLALSEQIGFGLAYLLAASALLAIIGGYCSAILGHRRHGVLATIMLAGIYLLLYWLVISEAYSLLVGALFLLALLALAMYLTRHVDWYQIKSDATTGA